MPPRTMTGTAQRFVFAPQYREDLIEHAVCRGEMASFDVLGHDLSEQLRIRKGSPAAREDRLSLLDEMTQKQMSNYRPDQLATMLRQRENVQSVIQLQRLRNDSAEIISRRTFSNIFEGAPAPFEYRKPWVCSIQEECQYRLCPRCRPALSDRAFLSLNAVANGDIPPTAAVGFGFHVMGERPVLNAAVVKNLGCREPASFRPAQVPVRDPVRPPPPPPKSPIGRSAFRSEDSIRQRFGRPFATPQPTQPGFDKEGDAGQSQKLISGSQTPGSLKHSPRCENLGKYADMSRDRAGTPLPSLPWTPPPSPNPGGDADRSEGADHKMVKDEGHAEKTGTSSTSTAPESFPGGGVADEGGEPGLGGVEMSRLPPSADRMFRPKTPRQMEDPGDRRPAGHSPSPHGDSPRRFAPSPLRIGHGVAVLEESVELGVPDVITQA